MNYSDQKGARLNRPTTFNKLLIEDNPLQVLPQLALAIGLNEALFLQQLHYWVRKSKDGWIYNTYEQWQEQFPFWSTATIKRIVYSLEDKGLIISKQPDSFDRKKYYSINYDQFDTLGTPDRSDRIEGMSQNETFRTDQDETFITENTTETTNQEIKYSASSQSDEPELIYIDEPIVKEFKNSDNKADSFDKGPNAYDNDTYIEFPPNFQALSTTRKAKVTPSGHLSRPPKLASPNNSDHYRFYLALCEVTNNNPALQSRKVHGMSKKLVKAGYTIQDLQDFKLFWQRDWRYLRDKRMPTPEELYSDIEKSKALFKESVQEELDEQALKDMFVDGQIPDILRQEKTYDQ